MADREIDELDAVGKYWADTNRIADHHVKIAVKFLNSVEVGESRAAAFAALAAFVPPCFVFTPGGQTRWRRKKGFSSGGVARPGLG